MVTVMHPHSFYEFLSSKEKALRRIANRTPGYLTIDELQSEAWLVAEDIGLNRGYPIDFTDYDDQETILGWLHNRLVKFSEKQIRYAIRLDEDWDNENGDSAINARTLLLMAPPDSDPLVWLQQKEDFINFPEMIQCSYSEASAYVLLLIKFDWNVEDLATHLHIVDGTLRRRLILSGVRARIRPSLFDRVEFIDPDFIPLQARQYREKIKVGWASWQSCWSF